MDTVMEIEAAIRALPQNEFWQLAKRFDEVRENAWDKQIEADAKAGRLDFLFDEADAEGQAGTAQLWPAKISS